MYTHTTHFTETEINWGGKESDFTAALQYATEFLFSLLI